jgi:anti-sigma factor RsiW
MSSPTPNDDAQLREELVAYLDGELDSQARRRIDERLVHDSQARKLLHSLEQSWELLDELDTPAVPDDFTRTTLEMVAVAAEADGEKRQVVAGHRRWRVVLALETLLVAAAAAFAITARTMPDPNRDLLNDLPLLQDLDHLREVDDMKFLRMLEHEKLFAEDSDDGQ